MEKIHTKPGRLRLSRIRAGVSAAAAARHVGVSVQLYYYWETGDRIPDPKRLKKLLDFFRSAA